MSKKNYLKYLEYARRIAAETNTSLPSRQRKYVEEVVADRLEVGCIVLGEPGESSPANSAENSPANSAARRAGKILTAPKAGRGPAALRFLQELEEGAVAVDLPPSTYARLRRAAQWPLLQTAWVMLEAGELGEAARLAGDVASLDGLTGKSRESLAALDRRIAAAMGPLGPQIAKLRAEL